MVVLVILAVTLALALPAYVTQVQASHRNLATAALLDTLARQEQYFVQHRRYADDLKLLGHTDSPYGLGRKGKESTAADDAAIYIIELTTSASGFTLVAKPQRDQSSDKLCGALSITSKGIRGASGRAPGACW